MTETRVQRTLVKSPPELWAEISDAAALARRLEAFGEIRITRLEPETAVAWEGDTARGTVELEPSGWGTKVTVCAEAVAETVEVPEPEPVAEPEPPVAPEAEPEPEAAAPKPGFFRRLFRRRAAADAPEPAAEPEPVAPPEVEPEIVAAAPAAPDLDATLAAILDDLGSAHHRPFSRS
jgi:hypothetical protein